MATPPASMPIASSFWRVAQPLFAFFDPHMTLIGATSSWLEIGFCRKASAPRSRALTGLLNQHQQRDDNNRDIGSSILLRHGWFS